MNDRIEAIEAANRILFTARKATVFVNDTGHDLLCRAMGRLNDEMKAMVADEKGE